MFCTTDSYKTNIKKTCPSCGVEIKNGQKFCGNCGFQLTEQTNNYSNTNYHNLTLKQSGSTKNRIYPNKAELLFEAAEIVKEVLITENLEYQEFEEPNAILIQARKPPKIWKTLLGLEIAASIKLTKEGDDLVVNIGGGKWLDKAAGGAIFWFVFWPAILTTGWGIYIQQQLFKKIDNALIANLN